MRQVRPGARGRSHEKTPKSWQKQFFRAVLIGGVLSVAAVGAARCDIDGGLLDPGSTASRQQDEQVRSVAVAAGDREYLAAHKHDVHADVITFADAVCTATESVRTAVTEQSDEPRTVERAVAESKSDLRGLADAAALAADRIDSVALPATDRVLTPESTARPGGRCVFRPRVLSGTRAVCCVVSVTVWTRTDTPMRPRHRGRSAARTMRPGRGSPRSVPPSTT